MKMSVLGWIAYVLVIVGAVNWGLFGAFGLDLVKSVLGEAMLAKTVYVLVGLSGVYMIFAAMKPSQPTM